jgi:7-cyano-7-deazaguanine tRNA-ribosyltransferase
MEVSLKGAIETIGELRGSATTWVGPIQGGLFPDLVRRSTKGLCSAGFEMLALGSPVELMENYRFTELVEMIVGAKRSMPYSLPLHLFGAGHPLTLPLSVALGCDTFDSASYVLFAKQDRYMTDRGTLSLEQMAYLPCSCPACNSTSRTELAQMERDERVRRLSLHNLYLLRQEVLKCKEAISEGRLWDLVEERAYAHPRVKLAFEALTKHSKWLAVPTPRLKERGLLLRSRLDEARPELANSAEMLRGAVKRSTPSAVLVCSTEEKPLFRTRAYRRLTKAATKERRDVYKLHSRLGPYPAELEFVFPFTQTLIPSSYGQRQIREAVASLKRMGYRKVVVCKEEDGKARSR